MESVEGNRLIIRFENIYAKDEDATLSKPVTITLNGLFVAFEITDFTELNLAGNQFASEKRALNWKTSSYGDTVGSSKCIHRIGSKIVVVVGPMQICTFDCEVKMK